VRWLTDGGCNNFLFATKPLVKVALRVLVLLVFDPWSEHSMKFISLLLSCLSLLFASGCTTAAWYESMQQSAINNCDKQESGARADCLSRVNKKSQSSYEKERSGQ